MDTAERYFREADRRNRANRRTQFRQQIADGLRVIAAAKAAGFQVKGAIIAGFELQLGAPEPAKAAEDPPRVALFQTRTNPKQKVVL
jgi:hypothetical protein